MTHRSELAGPEPATAFDTARIPTDRDEVVCEVSGCDLKLTNLRKPFFPERGLTKGDLLRYYARVARWILPHLQDRAMVMKRYPNGIHEKHFFMKRAPKGRPDCVAICTIDHGNGNVIDFPVIQDLAGLLWVINLGCIDLNPWYARCDDVDRPDYLHFDLDPHEAPFSQVRDVALLLRDALGELAMPSFPKTSGSKGIHVYVPIGRGPTQKEVWTVAKAVAKELESRHPELVTAEWSRAKRPKGRVLVDYNQNRWGSTLASVYSVRPRPEAPVSMPVTWEEVEQGVRIEDFTLANAPERLERLGDLFAPTLPDAPARYDLAHALEVV